MSLLRDDPEFATAIDRAARILKQPRSFVEKDYWVTQVLRALHAHLEGGFVLKGGTSLSKGYGIIDRFSEDVDILVVRRAGASAAGSEASLRSITETVAADLGLPWEVARDPGHGNDASRGDYIRYPSRPEAGLSLPIGPDAVLLETGFAGGHEPAEMVRIEPILTRPLDLDPREHDDTRPFSLRVLEPRRTLIEKLFAVHHVATSWNTANPPNENRFGRHYYDIYRLLDHRATLSKLEQRDRFDDIVNDVERVSRRHFRSATTRPAGGFATSSAFTAQRGTDLRRWLEENYQIALALVPESTPRPSFGQVLQRVEQRASLL